MGEEPIANAAVSGETDEPIPGAPQDAAAEAGPLARKLRFLLDQVHPPGKPRYTYRHLATEIAARGGPTVSPQYLNGLVLGKKSAPSGALLVALADFFGVQPAYLLETDPEAEARLEKQVELLVLLRDSNIRNLAARAADLSPASMDLLLAMVEQVRKSEGLDPPDGLTAPDSDNG